MVKTSITIDDLHVQTALAKLARQINNKRPVLTEIGEEVKQLTRHRFDIATSPNGVKWLSLKHGTRKPLYLSGNLHDSIISDPSANSVAIGPSGATEKYAETHQFGKVIDRVFKKAGRRQIKIPARPYLPTDEFPTSYRDAIVRIIERHLQAGITT